MQLPEFKLVSEETSVKRSLGILNKEIFFGGTPKRKLSGTMSNSRSKGYKRGCRKQMDNEASNSHSMKKFLTINRPYLDQNLVTPEEYDDNNYTDGEDSI